MKASFPLGTLTAAASLLASLQAFAAPQTRDQQACITRLNTAGARVSVAAAKNVTKCVRAALAKKLPPGETPEQCIAADHAGRITKARAATELTFAARCGTPPDFGAGDADVVNDGYEATTFAAALFGNDLATALAAGVVDPAVAACQAAAVKHVSRSLKLAHKQFARCAKPGLSGATIDDGDTLGACFDPGAAGTVADPLLARCSGVSLASAFPGACGGTSLSNLPACIDRLASCDASLEIEHANAVSTVRPHEFAGGIAAAYCGARPSTGFSVARQWDEETLAAIRIDVPRPPVHARNLFHVSVAMWDAWAAYDTTADGYLMTEKRTAPDVVAARDAAISFAAYRVLVDRYAISPNAAKTAIALRLRMNALGYDPAFTTTVGTGPAALGNRIGEAVIAYGLTDGSGELGNYADPTYTPANDPMIVKEPGTTMLEANRWQPLVLDTIIGQNGVPIPGNIQTFVGSQWGAVQPFAIDFPSLLPAAPPRLRDAVTDADFKEQAIEVIRLSSRLDPDDGAVLDISPASLGDNSLGTNDGSGYALNPVTGEAYAPEIVKRADFGRVLAEFWADGPNSETPPGHWNTIANYVTDHPAFDRRLEGSGPTLDALEWDVKMYLALNGALHDAAIGAWGTKRVYDSVRPISMIRYMGGLGQSSDPLGPSYDPDGLPLEPGLVEVITPETSAPGERHEALATFVGEIAILAWPGQPADPNTEYSGVAWVRAKTWVPYQRSTFVTPPFPGYVSGHSTFSRSAAEVLTRMTGSQYFPGGLGEFTAPQDTFLAFETGPTTPVILEWASYYDAADQAGQSRLWGGIHITADDFTGRVMGSLIGNLAYDAAAAYFGGTAVP